MYPARPLRHGLKRVFPGSIGCRRGIVTEAEVEQARKYCVRQLQHGDYEAYLLRRFVPRPAQTAYDALRALNLELVRLPETVSSPAIGRFRMQFWRDSIDAVFAGHPPREPISILLHQALTELAARAGGDAGSSSLKFWLHRFINTREHYMDNRPFPSLAALEDYGEKTYATLTYCALAAMPLRSVHVDHLASHIGKACGIVATLRGVPVLAAPPRPIKGPAGSDLGTTRGPVVLLPLDVMAEVNLREEDVFRKGPAAQGLQDAVFKVATRANDHLITAREMLKNLRAGDSPGHEYEHVGEAEHTYSNAGDADSDTRRGQEQLETALEHMAGLEPATTMTLNRQAVPPDTSSRITRRPSYNFQYGHLRRGPAGGPWRLPRTPRRSAHCERILGCNAGDAADTSQLSLPRFISGSGEPRAAYGGHIQRVQCGSVHFHMVALFDRPFERDPRFKLFSRFTPDQAWPRYRVHLLTGMSCSAIEKRRGIQFPRLTLIDTTLRFDFMCNFQFYPVPSPARESRPRCPKTNNHVL